MCSRSADIAPFIPRLLSHFQTIHLSWIKKEDNLHKINLHEINSFEMKNIPWRLYDFLWDKEKTRNQERLSFPPQSSALSLRTACKRVSGHASERVSAAERARVVSSAEQANKWAEQVNERAERLSAWVSSKPPCSVITKRVNEWFHRINDSFVCYWVINLAFQILRTNNEHGDKTQTSLMRN